MIRRALVLVVLTLLVGLPQAAQNAATQAQRFQTESELVTIDVVVLDDRGVPIRGLDASAFAVSEDGRPQAIEFFQPVVIGEAAAEERAPVRTSYGYSTNVGGQARPMRSFVLFFDDVHLTEEQGERAKKAIGRFLEDEAASGDLVSLVAPGRGLRWHARLPDGRQDLLQTLASLRGGYLPEATSERISDYEAYRIHVMQDEQMAERVGRRFSNLGVAGRDRINMQRDEGPRPERKGGAAGLIEPFVQARAVEAYARAAARNRATLTGLSQTIESMASVRARKSLIIISPGFIMDQELPLFPGVEDAARRANIAMYFVDARGLEVQSVFASAQFGSPLDSRDVGAANADLTLEAEGAASLAESSGGFSVRNSNDLAAGLRRIGRESQAYYLLGYRPPATRPDGKFRRIAVRLDRPDVQVRARKGYYPAGSREVAGARSKADPGARPDSSGAGAIDPLEVALQSPYDVDELPLRAATYVFGKVTATESSVTLAAETDLRAYDLQAASGTFNDVFDVRMLVTNPASGETKRYERAVEMTLQSRPPQTETTAWYPVSQPFDLVPGRYQARIAMRDRNSGRVGAVTHDFVVPTRNGLTLSTLIVTDTIEPQVKAILGPPRAVLIVRRLFPRGATLYYQFSVFDAGRTADGQTRVTAGHVLRRADGTIVKALSPTALAPGEHGLSRFAGVSLVGFPPGEYELVVDVKDGVRGDTVTAVERFAIAEGSAR
jgi:VWFA-related protein